jgi:ABC-type multidrug transport system ATPase subunit
MTAVTLQQVVKRYGRRIALDGLSMSLPRGSICALIGPNGSGKTTTMGVIAGLLKVESGSIDVLGNGAFDPRKHAGKVTLMPQDAPPSLHLPIIDCLRYCAELQGLERYSAKREALACLELVQLNDRSQARFGQLSHGMRRRFSVAQALIGNPDLILLDEPTSGLDPDLVVLIRNLIVKKRGEATLLVSSHILSELESTCDYAVFMQQGKVIRQSYVSELSSSNSLVRYMLTRVPNLQELELGLQGCSIQWQEPVLSVRAPKSQSIEATNARCLRLLLDQSVGILGVDAGNSLEATYLNLKQEPQAGN